MSTISFEGSNVQSYLNFVRRLRSDELQRVLKEKYESEAFAFETESLAKEIIRALVYDVYEPTSYKRTFNALNSVKVRPDASSKDESSLTLFSDPEVAPSETDPTLSYLAFFENPVGYKSFIQPRGVQSIVNYRPFFAAWEAMMIDRTNKLAVRAMYDAITDLMPNDVR